MKKKILKANHLLLLEASFLITVINCGSLLDLLNQWCGHFLDLVFNVDFIALNLPHIWEALRGRHTIIGANFLDAINFKDVLDSLICLQVDKKGSAFIITWLELFILLIWIVIGITEVGVASLELFNERFQVQFGLKAVETHFIHWEKELSDLKVIGVGVL